MKFAILIHLLNWDNEDKEFIIDEGITFVNLKNHPIDKLYRKMQSKGKIDVDGQFEFDTAIILHDDSNSDPSFLPTESKYSLFQTFINLLTIIFKGTLGHCRVIISKNDFKTVIGTYELYERQGEFIGLDKLVVYHSKFDKENLEHLKLIWFNLRSIWATDTQKSRIENALNFYYFSWNTLTLEQTGICLSIVLETLFSPHSNTELIHQIAFNISKFKGKDKNEKTKIYKYIKRYYAIRSKLVHGETISEYELDSIPEFFKFTSDLILQIISDKKLIHIFNDNKLRKDFIEDQLFD